MNKNINNELLNGSFEKFVYFLEIPVSQRPEDRRRKGGEGNTYLRTNKVDYAVVHDREVFHAILEITHVAEEVLWLSAG